MSLFNRPLTAADIAARIAEFGSETAKILQEYDAAQRGVSAALARGTDPGKLLRDATALKVSLDSRPLALQALQRELRRAQRAEKVADLQQQEGAAKRWAEGMHKAGDKVLDGLDALAEALDRWREAAAARPPLAGPAGETPMGMQLFAPVLRLEAMADPVHDLVAGLEPRALQLAAAKSAVTIARNRIAETACGRLAAALAAAEAEERRDAEVFAPEPEPAAAVK